MRTVMILGAGASAASDFQLPVMSSFFGTDIEPTSRIGQLLDWMYPGEYADRYNLEEVLAFLDLARARAPVWGFMPPRGNLPRNPQRLYDDVVALVKKRLAIPKDRVCTVHRKLFNTLTPRDTVATFNYDLVADQALLELHRTQDRHSRVGKLEELLGDYSYFGQSPLTLQPEEQEIGFYFKLHGSLDWLHCPTPACPNNNRFYPTGITAAPEGQEEGRPCRLCGAAVRTLLVPPVATKRLEDRGRLALLWNLTLREIEQADRLVVIGLSIAPSDFELAWLIRQSMSLKSDDLDVVVVNPNSSHQDRLAAILPDNGKLTARYRSIDQYLELVD